MKTLDDASMNWKQEYEILRQEALRADPYRGHGLALFLSHGMVSWLEALTALRSRAVGSTTQESVDLPSVLPPDLTTVLANMVLSCMRGEMHEPIQ